MKSSEAMDQISSEAAPTRHNPWRQHQGFSKRGILEAPSKGLGFRVKGLGFRYVGFPEHGRSLFPVLLLETTTYTSERNVGCLKDFVEDVLRNSETRTGETVTFADR